MGIARNPVRPAHGVDRPVEKVKESRLGELLQQADGRQPVGVAVEQVKALVRMAASEVLEGGSQVGGNKLDLFPDSLVKRSLEGKKVPAQDDRVRPFFFRQPQKFFVQGDVSVKI